MAGRRRSTRRHRREPIRRRPLVREDAAEGPRAGQVAEVAEALFAALLLPTAWLYLEPLVDLDRTMDIANGVLDRLCNPRPIFHALRCLNTLLYAHRKAWVPEEREEKGVRILALLSEEHVLELLLPEEPVGWTSASQRIYDLAGGTVAVDTDKVLIAGPSLVYT